jgi:hypothetical protein
MNHEKNGTKSLTRPKLAAGSSHGQWWSQTLKFVLSFKICGVRYIYFHLFLISFYIIYTCREFAKKLYGQLSTQVTMWLRHCGPHGVGAMNHGHVDIDPSHARTRAWDGSMSTPIRMHMYVSYCWTGEIQRLWHRPKGNGRSDQNMVPTHQNKLDIWYSPLLY